MSDKSVTKEAGTSRGYALGACMRMLRPVVLLALRFGLKYHDMDNMMKQLLLDEATKELQRGKGALPSASQLSVTTGVHRKDIRRLQEEVSDALEVLSNERSQASQVFHLWLHKTELKSLPLQGTGRYWSFEKLVKQIGSDVHFRSVLGELERLGLVREDDGAVTRLQDEFLSRDTDAQMLANLSKNIQAHISAGVSNVTHAQTPFLEQDVWATNFSRDACIATQEAARTSWQQVKVGLLKKLEEVNTDEPPADPHQLRIGMYMFYEPMEGARS